MMSPQERVSRLRVWQETLLELDARLRELMDLTGGVDGTLQNAINETATQYTKAIAEIVGDVSGPDVHSWLEWWWFECDLGRVPMKASPAGGNLRLIDSIEKLAELLG